jgi:hypothetical protein
MGFSRLPSTFPDDIIQLEDSKRREIIAECKLIRLISLFLSNSIARIEGASETGRGGNGPELSIVYGIVKDHDGHIDARSKIGVGSEFTVYSLVTRWLGAGEIGKKCLVPASITHLP